MSQMRVADRAHGLTVNAIAGTYVVQLGFDVTASARKGLLGFAVHRSDDTEHEQKWIVNRRTFAGREGGRNYWPTSEAPVQKFRWGDYTAKPAHSYRYRIQPAYGEPGAIEVGDGVEIAIDTEDPNELIHPDGTVHQVHFSRSGAASQAYVEKFGNRSPDEVGPPALEWLSRGLLEALLAFIDRTEQGDELHLVIYEIQLEAILDRLKAAVDRGVEVQILYDAGSSPTAPTKKNRSQLRKAGLTKQSKARKGLRSYICHHKFVVLVRGGVPTAVWTGSTNMSEHGIYAQLNVGHSVTSEPIASAYLALHQELWNSDPPARLTRQYLTDAYPNIVPTRQATASFIFSPRSQEEAMEYYLSLLRKAKHLVVLTTPFGVDSRIENYLRTSSPKVVKFGLTGTPGDKGGKVRRIDSINGTRYAIPARIETNALDHWQIELFGETSHAYIHSKFLLIDPLGDRPTLVTGSANFSRASCINNDEDMLVIKNHSPAADVYLTEFFRMFEHYSFREYLELHPNQRRSLPLDPTNQWTDIYFTAGSERERDRLLFAGKDVH
jgi:phosphatidylserine/phosphatidylglycerophosphate/cardiolipin synthase-like enzyme